MPAFYVVLWCAFFGRIVENTFGGLAERHVDGWGERLTYERFLNFCSKRFPARCGQQRPQINTFARHAKQEVFGFYVARSGIAGFKSREKNDAPGRFGEALEHSGSKRGLYVPFEFQAW